MEKPDLYVYRPVSRNSLDNVRRAQKVVSSKRTGSPVDLPHWTLLGGRHLRDRVAQASNIELQSVVWPLPTSGSESLTLPTKEVKMVGNALKGFKYIIELEDPDGVYREETALLRARALGKLGLNPVQFARNPHVTLGAINPEFAMAGVIEDIAERIPETVSFDPIVTPFYARRPPAKVIVENHVYSLTDVTVRRINGAGIPSAMIQSLRARSAQE